MKISTYDTLREDLTWQTAIERNKDLASSPTLCRLKSRANQDTAVRVTKVFVEQFISTFKEAPRELVLDFDATDEIVSMGSKKVAFSWLLQRLLFSSTLCFLWRSTASELFEAKQYHAAKDAWTILSLVVKKLRLEWPEVKIIFRGGSGFCRWKMMHWCEKNKVDYTIGSARNPRLTPLLEPQLLQAQEEFETHGEKSCRFTWLFYKADS